MKSALLLAVSLLAGCTSAHDKSAETSDTSPIHEDPVPATPANNRDWLPAALEIIDGASSRVDVAEYVVYDEPEVRQVTDALIAAAARGVTVRFLADETGSETRAMLDLMAKGGVSTQIDTTARTTHNKLIVSDDHVLVGSTNLTRPSITSNNEVDVKVDDATIAGWYRAYHEALWADSARDPDVHPPTDGPIVPLFNRAVQPALLDCIADARSEIAVLLYAIAWSDSYADSPVNALVNALVDAKARGVAVRVDMDNSEWMDKKNINDRAAEVLTEAGIEVRFTSSSVTTHAKLLTCDSRVIVSDANWSYSALEEYNSTGVQVENRDFADEYRRYFQTIWYNSGAR